MGVLCPGLYTGDTTVMPFLISEFLFSTLDYSQATAPPIA